MDGDPSIVKLLPPMQISRSPTYTEAAGGGGEGEARDTESKTRTPHKDVGNKKAIMLHPDIKTFSCSTIFLYL